MALSSLSLQRNVEELNARLLSLDALTMAGSVASSHQPICVSVYIEVVGADRDRSHNAAFLPTHYQLSFDYDVEHPQDPPGSRGCTSHFGGKV